VADTALRAQAWSGADHGLAGVRERGAAAARRRAAGRRPDGCFRLSVTLPLATTAGTRGAAR